MDLFWTATGCYTILSLLLLLINVTVVPDGSLTHAWKSKGHQSYTQLGWTGRLKSSFKNIYVEKDSESTVLRAEGKAGH